ncbi:MAG TPA: heme-binding protein [Candidatus Dormibacteraeota bacterium]|nr:heme-binding protein [Candidatus Dormibacteraeota bacterium]
MPPVHTLRKPVQSRHALRQRNRTLALGIVLALGVAGVLAFLLVGCGPGAAVPTPTPPPPAVQPLQTADVQSVINSAVASVNVDMVVAVVDRAGFVLGVFRTQNAPTTAIGNFGQTQDANDVAVALGRTGAFFSNDAAPLSSRTVRFISGIHFPPGVMNQPNADLYGIENTNRGCTLVNDATFMSKVPPSLALGGGFGLGILTGKADTNDSDPNAVNPGGLPIFYKGIVLGGVGVVTSSSNTNVAEFAAFTGSLAQRPATLDNLGPTPAQPGVVFIGGIALPFVRQSTRPPGISAGPVAGTGTFKAPLANSQGQPPEGDLITPTNGTGGLSAADVTTILNNAEATANKTRAAIRLPLGSRTRMVIAVADTDGTIIGLRRMVDSTIFSIDVAASKARNMIYFNSSARTAADLTDVPMGTAVTNRTISFGAMPFYPPGIDGSQPGPFFNLYLQDTANPCTQGAQTGAANANKSGIVFFPGSAGLYRNGVLIGGLGVSGDGVDQDDFVTNGGTLGFEAPLAIRADQVIDRNVRLPYMKFPRNPTD